MLQSGYCICIIFVYDGAAILQMRSMPQDIRNFTELSPRERQIAEAYSGGASHKEIAQDLGVAPTTVRTHIGTIYRKLVATKIELLNTLFPKEATAEVASPLSTGNFDPGPVILVLPFVELMKQAEDYFCGGLTEDVLSRLGCLRGTRVIAGSRLYQNTSEQTSAQNLGEAVGASHILDGSVRTYGNRVRVTAKLTKVGSNVLVWTQKFDRTVDDVFAVQDEITHAIVHALQIEIVDGRMSLDEGGTENFDAWELFHRGVRQHLKYTKEGHLNAKSFFEQALEKDPTYLDAHTFLAWVPWQLARSAFSPDPDADYRTCCKLQEPFLATGLRTATQTHLHAATLLMLGDHDEAVIQAKRAIELGPSKAFGQTPSALVLGYSGHIEDAVGVLRDSMNAIPHAPNDIIYNLAWMYSLLGEHARSVVYAVEYAKRVPEDVFSWTLLAVCHQRAGNDPQARLATARLAERFPNYTVAAFEKREPFRLATDFDKLRSALRDAGWG